MRKLIINTIELAQLSKEFLPQETFDINVSEAPYQIVDFLCENMLTCVCADDSALEIIDATLEAGYAAGQAGCDEVTLVADDDDGSSIWIMKGSSEKLLRDLTQHMKDVK